MRYAFEKILSIPKSLYLCVKLMPLRQALHLPVMVRYNCKITSAKGKIRLNAPIRPMMMTVGFESVGIFDKKYERSSVQIDGELELGSGKVMIGQGGRLCIMEGANLRFKGKFENSAMIEIICKNNISIGNNVLTSWDILMMDTDFHQTINTCDGIRNSAEGKITIGDNVWIGARCVVLKNTDIPAGCVVGANTTVNKNFTEENCLLVGYPAEVKKHNVTRANENE